MICFTVDFGEVKTAPTECNAKKNAFRRTMSPAYLHYSQAPQYGVYMNSIQTCNSVTLYFMRNSLSDITRKWILPNMIRIPENQLL